MTIVFVISLLLNVFLLILVSRDFLTNFFFSDEKNHSGQASAVSPDEIKIQENIRKNSRNEAEKLPALISQIISDKEQFNINLHAEKILQKIAFSFEAVQGAFYIMQKKGQSTVFRFIAGYAFYLPDSKPVEFELGEGLIGQVGKDKKLLNIDAAPFDHVPVFSGLGKTTPKHLIICPLIKDGTAIGIMEFSAFKPFSPAQEKELNSVTELLSRQLFFNRE